MQQSAPLTSTFTTTRFSTQLPGTFAEAVANFEREVPALSVAEFLDVIDKRCNWGDVRHSTSAHAPMRFSFWRDGRLGGACA